MRKGAAQTLSAEVLIYCGNVRPESESLHIIYYIEILWHYYPFDETTHLKPRIHGYLIANEMFFVGIWKVGNQPDGDNAQPNQPRPFLPWDRFGEERHNAS